MFSAEKVTELTGRSKTKGYLGNVVVDDTKQQFDMVFVTKSTNKKIKFDVYQFDYNLNLLNNFSDEQEVKNARTKYKWFKYRGDGENDVEVVEGATAEGNMMGKLVLKKIQTTFTYNWWRGEYEKETKLLDKVKPRDVDEDGGKGRKLIYIAHQTLDTKGELLIATLVNRGVMSMAKEGTREYSILRVNTNLEIIDRMPLTFDHPQSLVYNGSLPSGSEADDDMVLVFAPFGGQGYGKIADANPSNYTYVRLGADGKVKDRISFTSKCNYWAIYDVVEQAGGDIYMYGPGKIDHPEKEFTKGVYCITSDMAQQVRGSTREDALENEKFSNLQVLKISGGKVAFISAPTIDDINAKGIKPASQKKAFEFDGKRFILNNINIVSSGDIFINGQDFKMDNAGQVKGRVYRNLMMFQFDKDGNFKRYYGIENTAKGALLAGAGTAKSFPSQNTLVETSDGKSIIWNIFLTKDIDEDCSSTSYGTYCVFTPLYQGRMGKINIADGTVGDFKTYGGEDFYLYTDLENSKGKKMPYIDINGGKESIFLARQRKGGIKGNERWGTSIWMGKLDPSKL